MPIEVRLVESPDEAQRVFRLRYDVYIAELGRAQRHADHLARAIEEPLDQSALLWAAFDNTRLIGTLRCNFARDGDLFEYADLYCLSRVPAHPASTTITTKLLVAREYRHTSLAYRLAATAFRKALELGSTHDFIDAYPARVPLFMKLGYRIHIPEAEHPELGKVVVMRLDLHDAAHLARVRSPFLRHLLARKHAPLPQGLVAMARGRAENEGCSTGGRSGSRVSGGSR
jgi:GNAT superfamily N-acetyltransferase